MGNVPVMYWDVRDDLDVIKENYDQFVAACGAYESTVSRWFARKLVKFLHWFVLWVLGVDLDEPITHNVVMGVLKQLDSLP